MDILINNNRLAVEAGDFVLTDGLSQIKQHIVTALNTLLGEWVLNESKGINYVTGLRDTEYLENSVKRQILNVSGVNALDSFELFFDKTNLVISISAKIETDHGDLSFNETIKNN